jgi:hypothetical protein
MKRWFVVLLIAAAAIAVVTVARPRGPAGQGVIEGNEIPYQPWALVRKRENFKNRRTADLVEARGFLPGVPRVMYMPFPFQIVQTPKYIAVISEYSRAQRIIYTDGSRHPEGPLEFWMGDSRGRWDGNTLVVTTTNFTDKTNFRGASPNMKLVERFTRVDAETLDYQFTVDDPGSFTRSWTAAVPMTKTEGPIYEYACHEGNYGMTNLLSGARAEEK